MEDIGIAIGTANYSGNRKRTFKLERQKANNYRPLPPLGAAAEKGVWMLGLGVHWGDKGSDGKMRPYACIQRIEKQADGTKKVVRRCPRCEKNAKVQEKRDARAAELKTKGLSDEQISQRLTQVDAYLKQFNRSFRFYMNVLNEKMEIGRLDISGTHADQLREQINNLLKLGVDVTAPNQGVFMNFFYEGIRGHTVTPVMEQGANPGEMKLKLAPLTPAVLRSLKNEYWDLFDLFPSLTEAEIDRLVANEGDASVVDAIFSKGKVEEKKATMAAPTTVTVDDTKFDDGLDDMIGGKSAAPATTAPQTNNQPATAQAAPVQQAAPIPAPAQSIMEMSPEDFARDFGI
jgi:hypothetical protein